MTPRFVACGQSKNKDRVFSTPHVISVGHGWDNLSKFYDDEEYYEPLHAHGTSTEGVDIYTDRGPNERAFVRIVYTGCVRLCEYIKKYRGMKNPKD